MSKDLKALMLFSGAVLLASIGYYIYVGSVHPPSPERESWLSEVGEAIGEVALWAFVIIYLRTAMKLLMGKGPLARRLLPDYQPPQSTTYLQYALYWLDRSHVYVGVGAVALVLLHIVLMGLPLHILFFPAVLVLVLWQALFGLFLSWRYSPRDLRRVAYLVHAQLVTGVCIGLFAYFGHLLVDD